MSSDDKAYTSDEPRCFNQDFVETQREDEPMSLGESEEGSNSFDNRTDDEKFGNEEDVSSSKGTPIVELLGSGRWSALLINVQPSSNHTILYKLPWRPEQTPVPFPNTPCDRWDQEHVRMPNSSESLYPVQEAQDEKGLRLRWELVQEALLRNIVNTHQLESAILSYNSRYNERWNFRALHYLFNEVLGREETEIFFKNILPLMIQLALRLPELITGPIPLLRKHKTHSISLSQLQIGSLLANAFFCTFPRRNSTKKGSEYAAYPDINFNRLFQCGDPADSGSVLEKLKCILNYFRRICLSEPKGVVTFSRRYIAPGSFPDWSNCPKPLPKLHISSSGRIEDEGCGMLQVDFANKFVGGGVLGWGCVQEEIRFVICPELIVSRLFTECLDATEALIIVGCERFSTYKGYGYNFEWVGDFKDPTPIDSWGRRHCSIVAMDALFFSDPTVQYTMPSISREVNKAYVGFSETDYNDCKTLAPVATGNWGCGAFRGDAHLKALVQLMAAAEAGRSLVYFTFGDRNLRDRIFEMYTFLMKHKVTVGDLWSLLSQYSKKVNRGDSRTLPDLYEFLYSSVKEASTEQALKPSKDMKGFLLTRVPMAKSKLSSKNNVEEGGSKTGKGGKVNKSGIELTPEEVDALIEEFDSETELTEDSQTDELKKEETQFAKSIQENTAEASKEMNSVSSISSSCLSLIEDSLQNNDSSKKALRNTPQSTSFHQKKLLVDCQSRMDVQNDSSTDSRIASDAVENKSDEKSDVCTVVTEKTLVSSNSSELSSIPGDAGNSVQSESTSVSPFAKSHKRTSASKRKISDYFSPV